jgi:undecaprenyl diphosphate synthase
MQDTSPISSRSPSSLSVPKHIAIIMDGNNRWQKEQGAEFLEGHRAGTDAARKVIQLCVEHGISYLTLFAFSSENWQRPEREVKGLMELFRRFLQKAEINKLHENNIRLLFIGNRSGFSPQLQLLIQNAETLTAKNNGLCVFVAVSYGGHWDLLCAAKSLARQCKDGTLDLADITEEIFADKLSTAPAPMVDLCIRTGGELRISNFLLWQLAYAELYFTPTLWPDFEEVDFNLALAEFAKRQRRFGKKNEQQGHQDSTQGVSG